MADANMEHLKRAMQRESPAVVTAGDGPARRQVMIQFEVLKSSEGIVAQFQEKDVVLVQRLIDAKKPVVIWFQSEAKMLQFSAMLLKQRLHDGRRLLLIEKPSTISIVDERHKPRWLVPANFPLTAKIQVLAPDRAVEFESSAVVWDINMDGASLVCPSNKQLRGLVKEAWLKVMLKTAGTEYWYPALYRHMNPAAEQTMRLGVQFIPSGDPSAAAAHEALVKLIDELDQLCKGSGQSKPAANAA